MQKQSGRRKPKISFYVVDSHIQRYPLNYICNLPMHFNKTEKRDVAFVRLFGKNYELALSLMKKTLVEYEGDDEVKEEIWRRIRIYQRKKAI